MSDRYKSRGRKERTPEQLKVLEMAREKARLVIAERTKIKREMEDPPPEPEETEPPTPPPEPPAELPRCEFLPGVGRSSGGHPSGLAKLHLFLSILTPSGRSEGKTSPRKLYP